ncbi:MAG TPA: hypothetical protein VHL50_08920, partial [Pyrinomonadaceae bacterium]|nr:hypothetical protein [Pyrinomonadaceae bacterium]
MKRVRNYYKLLLFILFSAVAVNAQTSKVTPAMSADPQKDAVSAEFVTHVKAYVAAREKIDTALPPMPVKATAEQIEEHKT